MRIRGTFLRSVVARRVFLLFVASSFLPVAVLGFLSYEQVSDLTRAQEERRLWQTGSAQMHSVYDRLLGARFVLESFTLPHPGPAETDAAPRSEVFRRTLQLAGAALHDALHADPVTGRPWIDAVARSHLEKGETALLAPRSTDEGAAPWLARALHGPRLEDGIVVAELVPDYLWGKAEDLTHGIQLCIYAGGPVELQCSDPALGALARGSTQFGIGQIRESADGRWLVGSKALFLRPKFGAPDWTFVTLLPHGAASAAVGKVMASFLGVALLTLLLASFLSLIQIRRTLVPIERLVEGTRAIANEVFDRPVHVERGDEFGELAHSLNGMAVRLGRQIGAMRALSEIDHEILTRLDVEQVVERVHARLAELLPNAERGVIVYDGVSDGAATAYLRQHDRPTQRRKMELDAARLGAALPGRSGRWIEHASVEPAALRTELEALWHEPQSFIVPVRWGERIGGMLAIGGAAGAVIDDDTSRQLSSLADRIAVALAAARAKSS